MEWMIVVTVAAFISGERVLEFNGYYADRFTSEQACKDFKVTDAFMDEGPRLRKVAEQHLEHRPAKIDIGFECTLVVAPGTPV